MDNTKKRIEKEIKQAGEKAATCRTIEEELLAYDSPFIDIPYSAFRPIAFALGQLGYRKRSEVLTKIKKAIKENSTFLTDEQNKKTYIVISLEDFEKIIGE